MALACGDFDRTPAPLGRYGNRGGRAPDTPRRLIGPGAEAPPRFAIREKGWLG